MKEKKKLKYKLCLFSVPDITNSSKLNVLKQRKFIFLQFCGQKFNISFTGLKSSFLAGLHSLRALQKNLFSDSSSFW